MQQVPNLSHHIRFWYSEVLYGLMQLLIFMHVQFTFQCLPATDCIIICRVKCRQNSIQLRQRTVDYVRQDLGLATGIQEYVLLGKEGKERELV